MDSSTMTKTRPASTWTAVSPCSRLRATEGLRPQAPTGAVHRTGLSVAGMSEQVNGVFLGYAGGATSAQAVFAGVRSTDLPVPPPRGAPV